MGQKVHPIGYRLGVVKDWESKWYASGKNYAKNLHEDLKLRSHIKEKLSNAGVSRIEIERIANIIRFTIFAGRPGVVIGKGGSEVQGLRETLESMTGKKVLINVQEIKSADMEAQLVAENIASALERRVSFRRAMKQAVFRAMKAGSEGVKIQCGGRLGGAEIARTEWYLEGRLPLSTLRVDIDYGCATAHTIYGVIGVKVWVSKGVVRKKKTHEAVPVQVTE